jgi:hypothetical protein
MCLIKNTFLPAHKVKIKRAANVEMCTLNIVDAALSVAGSNKACSGRFARVAAKK